MTTFPAWFGGKADLTGGSQVVLVNDNADLLSAEASLLPGTWKLFPDTAAGEAAAEAFAGVKSSGIQPGNPIEGAASAVTKIPGIAAIGNFFGDLTSGAMWVRIGKIAVGIILILMGVDQLQKVKNMTADAGKAVTAAVATGAA
jgi:hypothetical protein